MIRTAISPRLAISTRAKGGPSLRKYGSERDVAMLLARVRVGLVGKHLEGADESWSGLGWTDHAVHVTARGGDIRVRELALVVGHEATSFRLRICGLRELVAEDDGDGA